MWSNQRVTDLAPPCPPVGTPASHLPGPVYAAVVVTWVASALTAGLTVLFTVAWLLLFHTVVEGFAGGSGNPQRWLITAAVVVVALSGVAALLARAVLRGSRRAYWGLLGLSLLAVVGGLFLVFFVLPLFLAAAAVAVIVLLLLPPSRSWARGPATSVGSGSIA